MKKFMLFIVLAILLMGKTGKGDDLYAATKKYKSISKTVTINKKTEDKYIEHLSVKTVNGNSMKKSPRMNVKVKIISIKGTPKMNGFRWLDYGDCESMGSLFHGVRATSFKKGKILNANNRKVIGKYKKADLWGNSSIELLLPEGVKQMKLKVTVYTTNKKKQIKSIKISREYMD